MKLLKFNPLKFISLLKIASFYLKPHSKLELLLSRRSIYAELQDFVQLELRDPLRKAVRNKKDLIRCDLKYIVFNMIIKVIYFDR